MDPGSELEEPVVGSNSVRSVSQGLIESGKTKTSNVVSLLAIVSAGEPSSLGHFSRPMNVIPPCARVKLQGGVIVRSGRRRIGTLTCWSELLGVLNCAGMGGI